MNDRRYSMSLYSPCFQNLPECLDTFEVRFEDDVKNNLGGFRAFALMRDKHYVIFTEKHSGFYDVSPNWKDRRLFGVAHTKSEALKRMHDRCREAASELVQKILGAKENLRWFEPNETTNIYERKDNTGTDAHPAMYFSDSLDITIQNHLENSRMA